MRHLARGLVDAGHKVSVLSMVPSSNAADGSVRGQWQEYSGIPYRTSESPALTKTSGTFRRKLAMQWHVLHAAQTAAIQHLQELCGRSGVDVLIGCAYGHIGLQRLLSYCRSCDIRIVRDVVEWWQAFTFPGGPLSPVYWNSWLNVHVSLPRSDGIIAISRTIAHRYERMGMNVIRVPAIIDPDQWQDGPARRVVSTSEPVQLTYVGNMNWRDEPVLLVRAIRHVLKRGHEVFLHVVGSEGKIGAGRKAKRIVDSDPILKSHVQFWGRVSDEMLRERLCDDTDALLFTRVPGKQAASAFPTRLPEFLMTGRPVIATAAGDIPEYLVDGKEAVLVKPASINSLVEGIEKIVNLDDRGQSIGLAGREKCVKCFHYRSRCQELSSFLENLIS